MSNELSMLEKFKQQHTALVTQRDQTHANYQQLIGAIHVCEQIIRELESNQKGDDNGNVNE